MLQSILCPFSTSFKSTINCFKNIPKIYTRKGDNGRSCVLRGFCSTKDHPIFNILGDVDELNSQIGLCSALIKEDKLKKTLSHIQNHLYRIGAYIATNNSKLLIQKEMDKKLEKEIDEMTNQLPPLYKLIHPSGSIEACQFHVARTIARRVERSYVNFSKKNETREDLLAFFNRLSDFLFISARYMNHINKVDEVYSI